VGRERREGEVSRSSGPTAPLWKRVLSSKHLVLLVAVAYFALVAFFEPGLASPRNLANIISNVLPLLVVAIGQTFVLIAGGIDLSVTAIIGVSSIAGGAIMSSSHGILGGSPLAVPAAAAAMVGTGAFLGFLNGAFISRTRVPAFMMTLTMKMLLGGLAVWGAQRIAGSQSISGLPAAFNVLGKDKHAGVPIPFMAATLIALLAHIVLTRSLFGRWLYASGRNPTASAISGVPVARVVTWAYVASGVCGGIAAMMYTARLETAAAAHGDRIFLDVIAATVIGGTSLFGGKGDVLGTIYGVLFITLLDSSLSYLGLSQFVVLMVKGTVILLAAVIDAARMRLLGRE
jgi:ribose/xylose/arabinose/galactoside ABC-type transport system permease subunit